MSVFQNMCGEAPTAEPNVEIFDYVIVGAGAAGCTLAHKLYKKTNRSVCVVEFGGQYDGSNKAQTDIQDFIFSYGTAFNKGYISTKEPGLCKRSLEHMSGRCLGGGTSVNTCLYYRASRKDMESWGSDEWGYDTCLEYFKEIETHPLGKSNPERHGSEGLMPVNKPQDHVAAAQFLRSAEMLGYEIRDDVNGHDHQGHSASFNEFNADFDGERTRRHDAYNCFLKPYMGRTSRVCVYPYSMVQRLKFDGKRAVGVDVEEVRFEGNKKFPTGVSKVIKARYEVIVSAGALITPKILMLSGVGPEDHIIQSGIEVLHNLPGVGQNLQDHVAAPVIFETQMEAPRPSVVQPASIFHRSEGDDVNDDFLMHYLDGQIFVNPTLYVRESFRNWNFLKQAFTFPHRVFARPRSAFSLGSSLLRPRSRGFIKLRSGDPLDDPVMQFNYFQDERDLDALVYSCKLARKIGAMPNMSPFIKKEIFPGPKVHTDKQWRKFIRENAFMGWHYAGTCKMGKASDPMAVVDDHCRVHGLEGLRVVDASIMPEVVGVNTNSTVLMLGLRAGDLLIDSEITPNVFEEDITAGPGRTLASESVVSSSA